MKTSTNYALNGSIFGSRVTVPEVDGHPISGELFQFGRSAYRRTLSFNSVSDIQEAINLLRSMEQAVEKHYRKLP